VFGPASSPPVQIRELLGVEIERLWLPAGRTEVEPLPSE
jgi:hypothetical protein